MIAHSTLLPVICLVLAVGAVVGCDRLDRNRAHPDDTASSVESDFATVVEADPMAIDTVAIDTIRSVETWDSAIEKEIDTAATFYPVLKSDCAGWTLTSEEIISAVANSKVTDFREVHDLYDTYPCTISTLVLVNDSVICRVEVNAGSWMFLRPVGINKQIDGEIVTGAVHGDYLTLVYEPMHSMFLAHRSDWLD